jgi:hypothetical protein
VRALLDQRCVWGKDGLLLGHLVESIDVLPVSVLLCGEALVYFGVVLQLFISAIVFVLQKAKSL